MTNLVLTPMSRESSKFPRVSQVEDANLPYFTVEKMLRRMNDLYSNYRGLSWIWQLGFLLVYPIFFLKIVISYTRISPLSSNPFCSRGFGMGFGCLNTESHRVFGAGPFKGASLVGTHQLLCGKDLHGRFCHWACRFYFLHASYALS